MKTARINPAEIPRIMAEAAEWLGRQTGLAIHAKDEKRFVQAIEVRLHETGSANFGDYMERLNSDSRFARIEAETLTAAITPAETYFLRDRGQLRVIEEELLPLLCARRRDERRLRLWSAGCASGEEAWSLSIILALCSELTADWDVAVLGTDINRLALHKAQRAEYGEWSFRQVSPAFRQQFFRPSASSLWTVNTRLIYPVHFFPFNLLSDALPDASLGLQEMDIIVCRNVFIYFSPEAIQQVVTRLIDCLRPGGFLVTGHGELSACQLTGLKHMLFAESSVYEKQLDAQAPLQHAVSAVKVATPLAAPVQPMPVAAVTAASLSSSALAASLLRSTPVVAPVSPASAGQDYFAQAQQRRLQGFPGEALKLLAWQSEAQRQSSASLLLAAHCEADLGHYAQARNHCRALLKTEPLFASGHYLLAQLALVDGDFSAAREALRATLCAAPEHVLAQLDLAALAEQEGDLPRAERLRQVVVGQLARLPANQPLPDGEVTPAELLRQLVPVDSPATAKKPC